MISGLHHWECILSQIVCITVRSVLTVSDSIRLWDLRLSWVSRAETCQTLWYTVPGWNIYTYGAVARYSKLQYAELYISGFGRGLRSLNGFVCSKVLAAGFALLYWGDCFAAVWNGWREGGKSSADSYLFWPGDLCRQPPGKGQCVQHTRTKATLCYLMFITGVVIIVEMCITVR